MERVAEIETEATEPFIGVYSIVAYHRSPVFCMIITGNPGPIPRLPLDRDTPTLAQAVEYGYCCQAGLEELALVDRRSAVGNPGDEGGELGGVALVLAGARGLAARPAVRRHAHGEEIVDGDDGAAGEELEALLAESGVAARGIDDGGEAAIGEMQRRGEIVAHTCLHRPGIGLDGDDIGVDEAAREIDEVTELAENAAAALRGGIDPALGRQRAGIDPEDEELRSRMLGEMGAGAHAHRREAAVEADPEKPRGRRPRRPQLCETRRI